MHRARGPSWTATLNLMKYLRKKVECRYYLILYSRNRNARRGIYDFLATGPGGWFRRRVGKVGTSLPGFRGHIHLYHSYTQILP